MFDPNKTPSWLNEDDWKDFQAHRKEIGRPMTDTAKRRMLMKLYRMREASEPISQCMERSMVNGWKDVYPIPPELRETKPQSHREFQRDSEPESNLTDEEVAKNVRYLKDALNGTRSS